MEALLRWTAGSFRALLAVAAVMGVATVVLVVWRARRLPRAEAVATTLRDMAVVAAVLFVLILTTRPADEEVSRELNVNLIPFRDLALALVGRISLSSALADIAGNIVVFVPLGAALAARYPQIRWLGMAVGVAVLSAGIETLQATLDMGRATDITDVLMNAVGALIGYCAWRLGEVSRGASATPR